MARGFKIADAYVDIHADRSALKGEVRGIPGEVGPDADKAGKGVGDKVSQGMRMAFIRNSPLIVAAIGGALALGGPAMLTAATGLFAGIGIVAAAQSDKVRSAWLGTWQAIQKGAISDAAPIEGVLVGLADRVQQRYESMRPMLRNIFSEAAPQIDVFGEGIIRLAENALPGFRRAVERGMPVTQGFAAFLEKTGTGITGFFDNISSHGPAAGAVWSSLGDSMAALLPTVGELLGQGTELAADVLPLLSGSLGAILAVTEALGPALPVVAAGFMAWKAAGVVSGMIGGLGDSLTGLGGRLQEGADGGSKFGSALETAGSAVSDLAGQAGPLLGAAVGGLAAIMAAGEQKTKDWANAIQAGGRAAADARDELADPGAWDTISIGFSNLFDADMWQGASTAELALEDTTEAMREMEASMTPAQLAASRLKQAENDLAYAIDEHGRGSREATQAQAAYQRASEENGRVQSELEQAIDGVTSAMLEQAEQAFAAIDSSFAWKQSQDDLADAQQRLVDLQKEGKFTSEELETAQRDVSEATWESAQAFGRQQADLSGASTDSAEYARILQTETLAQLYRLRDVAGPEIAGSLQQQINMLEASGISLQETGAHSKATADRMRDLGLEVRDVPGFKGVEINAPTEDQRRRIEGLGYQVVTLPNGDIYVTASTADAEARLNATARTRYSQVVQTVTRTFQDFGSLWAGGGQPSAKKALRGFAAGDMPSRRMPNGKLQGPGGPLDDLIPAMTAWGEMIRVANREWIINGAVSEQQGDRKMALLNAGRADIVPRFADGGPTSTGTRMAPSGSRIDNLHVHLNGTFDLRDKAGMRKMAMELKTMLDTIEREAR